MKNKKVMITMIVVISLLLTSIVTIAGLKLANIDIVKIAKNQNTEQQNEEVANESLNILKIDEFGLDATDRALLTLIIEKYDGGPVGIETLAAALSEDVRTLEDVSEPYLLQSGLLQRTPRGRKVSPEGYRHLGYKEISEQQTLF